jgi:hypothetical protein
MVFRRPAVIAQDFTAPMTRNGHPFQLASAVSADFDFDFEFEVGLMVILVRSWAMVAFWHKMVKTKNVAAPLARERRREFAKSFLANVATVHYA